MEQGTIKNILFQFDSPSIKLKQTGKQCKMVASLNSPEKKTPNYF